MPLYCVSLQSLHNLALSGQLLGVEGVVMKVINALEYPNFDYCSNNRIWSIDTDDGRAFFHAGQYSRVWQTESEVAIARDPLGCNKLFYGYNEKGELVVANRIERALKLGVHLDNLASCPPGQLIRVSDGQAVCALKNELFSLKDECSVNINDSFGLDSFQIEVAAKLK